jgi:hypothetical protein
VLFEVNRGAGIGHYITDLSSEGGQDGVFDTTAGIIRVLHASSAYGSYEHYWSSKIYSSFTGGFVMSARSTFSREARCSGRAAIRAMSSGHPNRGLNWSPNSSTVCARTKTHTTRPASQLQIGSTFRF